MSIDETSPTSRALLTLELIQNSPGISADRLAQRLDVSERAARRYVGMLREAGIPVDSVRGPYGGYRLGRGARVPPLRFSTPEALGLVIALMERRAGTGDPEDPVGSALAKIIRVLPAPVAETVEAVRRASTRSPDRGTVVPVPDTTTLVELVRASLAQRRVVVGYRLAPGRERPMEIQPWGVVVRHDRWYLVCWSHTAAARRVLRIDRVVSVQPTDESFEPPPDLDLVAALEEQLGQGWEHEVVVEIDAPIEIVSRWLRPNIGRLEITADGATRLVGSSDDPDVYVEHLLRVDAPFRVITPDSLRRALAAVGERYRDAAAKPVER